MQKNERLLSDFKDLNHEPVNKTEKIILFGSLIAAVLIFFYLFSPIF